MCRGGNAADPSWTADGRLHVRNAAVAPTSNLVAKEWGAAKLIMLLLTALVVVVQWRLIRRYRSVYAV